MDEALLRQIWADAAAAARERDGNEEEEDDGLDLFGDAEVTKVVDEPPVNEEEPRSEDDFDLVWEEQETEHNDSLARDDARWSLQHYQGSVQNARRYPKTALSTCIGSRYTPYNRMSRLQKTHLRVSKDNKESYLRIV